MGSKIKRAVTSSERARVRRDILAVLGKGQALFRREINTAVARMRGLSAAEGRDNAPDSRRNLLNSAIGTLLSDLCREGAVLRSAEGRYLLTCPAVHAIREAELREAILTFSKGEGHPRGEIYAHIEELFGTAKTAGREDDNALRCRAESLIARLLGEGELIAEGEYVRRVREEDEFFPDGQEDALRARYLDLLHRQGGPFLERFAVALLSDYYKATGRTVTCAEVIGGSQDGGIDGRIDTTDALGFRETILIQTKCRRSNIHVTERELRGFWGAVCAEGGSRGIFLTTSYFHEAGLRFLSRLPSCVGIDGERLFSLILDRRFGLHRKGGGYVIDRKLLSESL